MHAAQKTKLIKPEFTMLRYRLTGLLVLLFLAVSMHAQELFVFSEPASNMPAKSLGIRASNWLMNDISEDKINYHFIPEVMLGLNNKLMLHAEGFFSNRNGGMSAEGAGIYIKYRFLSYDEIHRHFRMAAFARASTNNGNIHQEEIMTNSHNTGYQLGIIGTELLHKTAISTTVYYEQAYNNFGGNKFPDQMANKAINYSVSFGRLIRPRHYIDYKQTNFNFMVEVLGQLLPENGKQYIDVAPALQFIFNSQTRLDIAYKKALYSNIQRTAPEGLLIRVEHLLFNVI